MTRPQTRGTECGEERGERGHQERLPGQQTFELELKGCFYFNYFLTFFL